MKYSVDMVLNAGKAFLPTLMTWGERWESLTFDNATISIYSFLSMVSEAILSVACNDMREINRLTIPAMDFPRSPSVDMAIGQKELIYYLFLLVDRGHKGIGDWSTIQYGHFKRNLFDISLAIMMTAAYVLEHRRIPTEIRKKAILQPASEIKLVPHAATAASPQPTAPAAVQHQQPRGVITMKRPVILITDNIHTPARDRAYMRDIQRRLEQRGIRVIRAIIDIDGEFAQMQQNRGDIVFVKFQYNCAGTIWGYTQPYFQRLKGNRPFVYVNMSPRTTLRGLRWLPRAHDDNFTPRSFRGLANPYQALRNAGIIVDESRNPQRQADTIFNAAVTVRPA